VAKPYPDGPTENIQIIGKIHGRFGDRNGEKEKRDHKKTNAGDYNVNE